MFLKLLAGMAAFAMFLGAQTDYRFAFPQSELLMGVDVKWLMKNPLLTDTLRGKDQKLNLGDLGPVSQLLDQMDTVHLSVISKNAKESDLLLLVQGRFDVDQLLQLGAQNGLRLEQWGKTKVLLPPAKAPTVRPARKPAFQKAQFQMDLSPAKPGFAILDRRRVVIGEQAILRVAIERLESGLTPQANPLFERARDLEAANDLWVVGSTAPLNQNLPGIEQANPIAKSMSQIRTFALGMTMRRDFKMDLSVQAVSTKAAAEILDIAKGVLAMAKMSPVPQGQKPIDYDKMVQISLNGNIVHAQFTVEQTEAERLMNAWTDPRLQKPVEAAKPVEPARKETQSAALIPSNPQPPPPTRKTVLIYGMPGGPKEVPVN